MRIWTCKIGETDFSQHGMDAPMRNAVFAAYLKLTGKEPDFIFSGWGGELDPIEREIVDEQRAPTPAPKEQTSE